MTTTKMVVDLLWFLVMFLLLLGGFSITMYSMFKKYDRYHGPGETLLTLFSVSLGDIEWGFESLVVSAEHGHYDNTYLFGSFLLSVFMLLSIVLLLNLVVANFSSTFKRIELRSYQVITVFI